MQEGWASRDAAHHQRPPGQDPGAATVPHAPMQSVRARRLSVLLGGGMDGSHRPHPGVEVDAGGGRPGCAGVMRSHPCALPIPCPCPRQLRSPGWAFWGRWVPSVPPPCTRGIARCCRLGSIGIRSKQMGSSCERQHEERAAGGSGAGARGLPSPCTDLRQARPSQSCQEKWADYGMNAGQGRAGMQPP